MHVMIIHGYKAIVWHNIHNNSLPVAIVKDVVNINADDPEKA